MPKDSDAKYKRYKKAQSFTVSYVENYAQRKFRNKEIIHKNTKVTNIAQHVAKWQWALRYLARKTD